MNDPQMWHELTNLGGPAVLLVALAAALAKAMKWSAPRVERVVEAHLALIQELRDATRRNSDALERHAESAAVLVRFLDATRRSLGHGAAALVAMADDQRREGVELHVERMLAELAIENDEFEMMNERKSESRERKADETEMTNMQ
jgi:ABC-type transporter Mla subunit MlaD